MKRIAVIAALAALALAGCNQPFEPNGPLDRTLVVYCILSTRVDTQYVRLSSTFGSPPAPSIPNARVTLSSGGRVVTFRDTTLMLRDTAGNYAPSHVYVAYHAPVTGGSACKLEVSTPSGLTASADAVPLNQPLLALKQGSTPGFFSLTRQFNSVAGAAILHFYLDYYVLVDSGWVLRTEEIPSERRVDEGGNESFTYPSVSPVAALVAGGTNVLIDSALFQGTRSRVLARYLPAPVVYLDVRFDLVQVDDVLYDYFYLKNGPVDNSSIRLDVPDFTNINGGFGVFGSRAEVVLFLPLER